MEEILIYKVQEKRLLYDTNLIKYKDNKARIQTWEEIAAELGLTALQCRDMWCRLRKSYCSARRRRLKKRHLSTYEKWKYEDQMSFLLPFAGISNESNKGNIWKSKHIDSPPREDINYTIDETVIDATGSDEDGYDADNRRKNDVPLAAATLDSRSNSSDLYSVFPNYKLGDSESLANSRSSLERLIAKMKPINSNKVNNTERTRSSSEEVIVVEDDFIKTQSAALNRDSEKNTLKFDRNSDTKNTVNGDENALSIVIKKPSARDEYSEEEEYYLRLARMAKKLKLPERIKLRESVSTIVLNAVINSVEED